MSSAYSKIRTLTIRKQYLFLLAYLLCPVSTGCPKKSVILVDMAITPLKSVRKGKNWHILQLRICGRICTNAPNLRRVIAMSTRITLFLGHPGVLDSWGHPVCPGYRGGGRTQGEQDAETRGRGPLRESPGDAAEVGRVYRDTCHICHVPHLLMG